MVLGYHIIVGMHGFWLPNDPRGSWSDFVGWYELRRYGPATKTTERRSLANKEHDRQWRQEAKTVLKYPPVELTGVQAQAVANGFAEYVRNSGLVVWACAILPDHLHLVVGRHRLKAEQFVIQMKGAATEHLIAATLHPYQTIRDPQGRVPRCFARGEWKVYLDTIEDVFRSIEYVENNPLKEGKPRQKWKFVTPFDSTALR
jgi:REP element-mobilizing transposase RayT